MSISIIIATFNRGKELVSILPSYLLQEDIKEIFIIDDRSSDNTEEIVKEFAKKDQRIKFIKNKVRSGTCKTKNTGLERATGDYVFFGEDDLELPRGFISTLIDHLKKNKADIISGRRIWPQPNETKEQSFERANKKNNSPVLYDFLLTDCETKIKSDMEVYLLDASMLLTRKAAKALRWDTDLFIDFVGWRSESDFQLSAAEKGFKMIFCPHVVAYHLPKYAKKIPKWSYLRYDLWVMRNNYFFSKKHWKFLKNKLNFSNFYLFNFRFIVDRIKKRYLSVIMFQLNKRFLKKKLI